MAIILRLIVGLFGLILITIMTVIFGVGGFFFTLGLFGVVFWAVKGR